MKTVKMLRTSWNITIKLAAILLTLPLLLSCEQLLEEKENTETQIMPFNNRVIVFYNVENLFDTKDDPKTRDNDFTPHGEYLWDTERYFTKLDRLSDALKLIDHAPILLGLAEVENRFVLEDLARSDVFDTLDMGIVHYDSPDQRGIDCALLYDKNLFNVKTSEKLEVELENNPNFKTRDVLYVKGEFAGGIEAHIFVNHWSSRRAGKKESEHKRIKSAEVLRDKIESITRHQPDAYIIVMGDFNDHPDDKSIEDVLEAKEYGEHDSDDLINLFADDHENNEGTSVHQRQWGVLDQIMISQSLYDRAGSLGVKGKDGYILREDELIFTYRDGGQKPSATYGGRKYFGGYSDHLPVYIILE